jgi:5-methylcytosine-specific restriction endonuclease McrA
MWNTPLDIGAQQIQSAFDEAKTDCSNNLAIIASQRKQIIHTNWRWRLFVFLVFLAILFVIGVSIFLFYLINSNWVLILAAIMILFVSETFQAQRKRVKLTIEVACSDALSSLMQQEEVFRNKLKAAETRYHEECASYKSYPPDWRWRRQIILLRDHHHCTNCGWPQGFLRQTREFHIHHVKSLAKGGDNSLENLTTLCHICHRNVDKYHSQVRKSSERNRWHRR